MFNHSLLLRTWTDLKDKITYNKSYYSSEISSLNNINSNLTNEYKNLEETIWSLRNEERTKKSRINDYLNNSLVDLGHGKQFADELMQHLEKKSNVGKVRNIKFSINTAIDEINKAKKRNGSDDGPTIEEVD